MDQIPCCPLPNECWELVFENFWEENSVGSLLLIRRICRKWNDLVDAWARRNFEVGSFIDLFDPQASRLEFLRGGLASELQMTLEIQPMVLKIEYGPFIHPRYRWFLQHWSEKSNFAGSNLLILLTGQNRIKRRFIDLTAELQYRYPQRCHHSLSRKKNKGGWMIQPNTTLSVMADQGHTTWTVQAGQAGHVYLLTLCLITFKLLDLVSIEAHQDTFSMFQGGAELLVSQFQIPKFTFNGSRVYRSHRQVLGLMEHWNDSLRLPILIGRPDSQNTRLAWSLTSWSCSHLGHCRTWKPSFWQDIRSGLSLLKLDASQTALWFWNFGTFGTERGFIPLFPLKLRPAERSLGSLSLRELSIRSYDQTKISTISNPHYLLESNFTRRWILILEFNPQLINAIKILEFSSLGSLISQVTLFTDAWNVLKEAGRPCSSDFNTPSNHRILIRKPCWTGSRTLHLGHIYQHVHFPSPCSAPSFEISALSIRLTRKKE